MPFALLNCLFHSQSYFLQPFLRRSSFNGSVPAARRSCREIARVSRRIAASSSSWENRNQQKPILVTNNDDSEGETPAFSPQPLASPSASDVVRNFYGEINRHNLSAVESLIAENCVYEDLVFPEPFIGRKDIIAFFRKFIDAISTDLQFVIDDISDEDTSAVGVTWHLEWKGTPFPFSKGCSFYRLDELNGTRQIIYARDCVEPAIKPGSSTLVILGGVAWLLQRFPQLVKWL